MEDCIFCKIAKKEIPAEIEKETDNLLVFRDINPKAKIHLLIVPKRHVEGISKADESTWNEIRTVALELAREKGLKGFTLGVNVGENAIVKHLHAHFLDKLGL